MVSAAAVWPSFLLALMVFGLLPGLVLRLIVRIYPKEHPRRRELVAELYNLDYFKRPFFVVQDLELAFCEGIPARWRSRRAGPTLEAPVPLAPSGYRGPQVCNVVGITYRQLDYWTRTDLIRPSIADAAGSDIPSRYAYTDLLELRLIKHLLDAGVSLRCARKAIQYLREQSGDLSTAHQGLTGNGPTLFRSDEEVIKFLRGGPSGVLTIVSLAGIKDEVDAAIFALRPAPARGQGLDAAD